MFCRIDPLPSVIRLGLAVAVAAVALASIAGPAAAQRPAFSLAKPHRFGVPTPGDSNQFVQVAAHSSSGRADGYTVNGVETKVRHEATIVAPNADASYSFSAGAYTTSGYWLQMGYIVLGSDGNGLARWFVQILNPDGSTHTWKLSRAGEANPPPACSACSGDAGAGGYPFAFTSDSSGNWTFWFDGIVKVKVSLGAAHNRVDTGRIYFLGEVTAPQVRDGGGQYHNIMGPRSTVRTLRLWSNQAGNWTEPTSAQAAYYGSPYGTVGPGACPPSPYGITYLNRSWDSYVNAWHHNVKAGSTVSCTPAGQNLW